MQKKFFMHKAGFVNILGNPNVGKSTLMNKLLGEKLSIITNKPQTTRHRIKGIINGENYQIVLSDTPGILEPKYKLQESMLKFVEEALSDADVIVYVTDPVDTKKQQRKYLDKIKSLGVPIIGVINKIDTVSQPEVMALIDEWQKIFPEAEIIPVSAMYNFNLQKLLDKIIELLPESPPYFPKDQLTDRPVRFFVAEIIREKIFEYYKQEVPYSVEVVVDEFKEYPNITKIYATIYVARESQKPIIIGKDGTALKKIGIEARKEIEAFLGTKVFLNLFVKVDKNWRDNLAKLKKYGYEY